MSKEIVIGEIDWNEGDIGGGQNSPGGFMKLKEGENVVRIMGNPVQYYIHWVQVPGGKSRKINSPVDTPKLVQKLEDAGFKRQAHWMVKVLDRSDDKFKLLEIGSQIYNGIRALFNNERWGKVTNYDISIIRGPKGAQPLYSITPNPKEPLSPSFKDSYIAFNDKVNMDKYTSPSSAEDVCSLLDWDMSDFSSGVTSEEMPTDDSDDEFDFNFQ